MRPDPPIPGEHTTLRPAADADLDLLIGKTSGAIPKASGMAAPLAA